MMNDADSISGQENPHEGRYLVVHAHCEPAQFTDASLARKHIERLKLQGFNSPDIFQFDNRSGGWRKISGDGDHTPDVEL